jgi:hypothetical protein
MNDWDRNNLNFFLTASPKAMQEWHRQAEQDDYDYALALIQTAQTELHLQALDQIDAEVQEDVSAAKSILARFAL